MDGNILTVEQFLKDVKDHSIKILRDDGVYRHIELSNNGSFNMKFEIITWPGYLAYTGDMGCYVFSRLEDMFVFFRSHDGNLNINTGYWAEKCKADSIYGNGIREFSVEKFRENVLNATRQALRLEEDENIPDNVMDEIQYILDCDNEYDCVSTMNDFRSKAIEFSDFWECNHMIKTYHYVWCCYALVWGIQQYDKVKGV